MPPDAAGAIVGIGMEPTHIDLHPEYVEWLRKQTKPLILQETFSLKSQLEQLQRENLAERKSASDALAVSKEQARTRNFWFLIAAFVFFLTGFAMPGLHAVMALFFVLYLWNRLETI